MMEIKSGETIDIESYDFNRFEVKTDTHQISYSDPFHPGEYSHRISFWIAGKQFTASFVSKSPEPNQIENQAHFANCFGTIARMLMEHVRRDKVWIP